MSGKGSAHLALRALDDGSKMLDGQGIRARLTHVAQGGEGPPSLPRDPALEVASQLSQAEGCRDRGACRRGHCAWQEHRVGTPHRQAGQEVSTRSSRLPVGSFRQPHRD